MKKTFAWLLALMMIIGMLPVTASADDVVTLYVTDWENEVINDDIRKACNEIFSVEHPNIKVEVISGSYNDYGQQITAMLQAGDNLDIFQQGYDGATSNYQKGLIMDLSSYVAAEPEFVEKFYPSAYAGFQYKDAVTGLPGLGNVYGFFYNKDIIAAKGLKEPTVDWTWDDFFALAEGLKDPANNVYGCYGLTTDVFGLNQLSASNGGAIYVDDLVNTTKVTVDDEMVKAAEKIASLIADGTLPKRNYSDDSLQSNFEAGTIGMLYYGQWEIDSLLRNCPDLNWGYAPIPAGSVCTANMYDYVGWSVSATTKHPDEAWELVKFLASTCYETVLVNSPVAACAYEPSAQVFFDILKDKGHADAADTVSLLMANPVKTPCRYAASWSDDAGKFWDTAYNNILDGVEGTPADLVKLSEDVNMVIEDSL